MVRCTTPPFRAAVRLNSGVRRVYRYQFPETAMKGFHRLAVMGCFAVLATTVNAQSSADQPTTADSTIARYCAAWSTTDPQARKSLLADSWSDNGEYVDPQPVRVSGRSALNNEILRFQKENPGSSFRCGKAQTHHRFVRYSWVMVGPDGAERFQGMDFGEINPAGRIIRIVSFFGAAPATE